MTHFVFPYRIPKAGTGWELKYAIRSIAKNFTDLFDITIIGDIPEWVDTTKVRCVQYNNSKLPIPVNTRINQLLLVAAELYEDFFWLDDDNYLIKPIDAKTLEVPRHLMQIPDKVIDDITPALEDLYIQRVIHTRQVLKDKGFRYTYSYCTHAPWFFNSAMVKELHTIFDITQEVDIHSPEAFIVENLYYNYFNIDSTGIDSFRAGYWGGNDNIPITGDTYILNHNDEGLLKNPEVFTKLKAVLCEKSVFEL